MIKKLFIVIWVFLVITGSLTAAQDFGELLGELSRGYYNAVNSQYDSEMSCVKDLISNGVERINIATGDGKCWEEENGYYN